MYISYTIDVQKKQESEGSNLGCKYTVFTSVISTF
jgi:hypothetical protein